jgi:hypothetical protein
MGPSLLAESVLALSSSLVRKETDVTELESRLVVIKAGMGEVEGGLERGQLCGTKTERRDKF